MSWGCRTYVLWVLLVGLVQAFKVESCIEEERLALLDLNSYFRSHGHPYPWRNGLGEREKDEYNCCTWEGVQCNSTTQHVIELDLVGLVESNQSPWVFNVTMLQPFRRLMSLDLSLNNIGGLVEKDGSARLSTLKNLQSFTLDYNYFESAHISLGALISLKNLSLWSCGLNESTFTIQENWTKLKALDLSGNEFRSLNFQHLKNPWDLRELHLSDNRFDNSILQELAHMTQLQVLDLSWNDSINNSNIQVFLNLTELQVLNLTGNNFYGSIQGFCKLKNILELRLEANQFTGQIPLCLSNCSSLQVLDLAGNQFEGKFSLSLFANFTKLRYLDLSWNQLVVQTEDSLWHPSFQLQHLGLRGCNLNKPDGSIPEFLRLQHNLSEIDLSDNHLVGSFPTWLITNNPHLQVLYLSNNSLTGYLQLPSYTWQSLDILDISTNKVQGKLPNNIGYVFPQLQFLDVDENHFEGLLPNSIAHMSQLQKLNMSGNHFEGSVPTSVASMSWLKVLDLSNNNFSGELPRELLSNCTELQILHLNDNNLRGDIIPEHMNLPNLYSLWLSNNSFDGTIKDALLRSPGLVYLDMSKNKVTGQLPSFIGNLQQLDGILLSSNNLQGHIPIEICKLQLSRLELSENNFTGPVPPCSNFSSLKYLHLHKNSLTGPIPNVLSRCSNLTTLDLWSNKLSGIIPPWIGMLVSLQVLLLAGNNLHGQIPQELCQLQNINILDLSRNHLSGEILTCFSNMSFGTRNITKDVHRAKSVPLGEVIYEAEVFSAPDEVELVVKNQYLSYTGSIRNLMSALDLSCNNLSGIIPPELGELTHVQSLNLSHNRLIGSIPSAFSNLKAVEGLDFSFNNLSGIIPNQLAELCFLEIFNVSYNSLTGRTPETGQFGNFIETSYYGNPGLCVSVENKSCSPELPNALPPLTNNTSGEDGDGGLDMEDFLWSFGVTSVVAFLATIAVLAINPQWREAWFDFVEWHLLWWLL